MVRFLLLLSLAVQPCVASASNQSLEAEARAIVKELAHSLKSTVKATMKASGPVATIEVCKILAPEKTAAVAVQHGWDVGRTSLKLRNPANRPDAWEQKTLLAFKERTIAGEAISQIDASAIIKTDSGRVFRYMKAIGVGKPCLSCHGAKLKDPVAKKLGALYPDDNARGYTAGQLRGAFTLSRQLDD